MMMEEHRQSRLALPCVRTFDLIMSEQSSADDGQKFFCACFGFLDAKTKKRPTVEYFQ